MRTEMMIFRPLLLSILVILAVDLLAADYSSPSGRVKDLTDRFLNIVQDNSLDRQARWHRLGDVVYDGFDFRSMSQSMVSSRWRQAGEDERRKYTDFFAQYLDAIYSPGLQNIILRDEVIQGDTAIVETVIHTDGNVIPIHFKLKNNRGDWFAYDVVIDDSSLLDIYQSTHAAITRNEGLEGLSSNIRRRIDKYRGDLPEYSEES